MENKTHSTHRWHDISHHLSPIYQCDFCGVLKSHEISCFPCTKADECLDKEAKQRELEERWEYSKLKQERERYEYLRNKYEGL